MRGLCEARTAVLLLVCAASLLASADAHARSLFQAGNSSNTTTTLFFAATSSAFMPGGSGTPAGTPAPGTTAAGTMAGTAAATGVRGTTRPMTTPSLTFPINVTVPPIPRVNITLPGVKGLVTVLESITFPVPTNLSQPYVMRFPASSMFAGVGANIPAGAWPAGDMRAPSMDIFTFQEEPELPTGARVNAEMVNFGPDGIKFNSPVEITVPLGETRINYDYNVRNYNESVSPPWIEKMGSNPAVRGGAGTSRLITGETEGFSPYGAIEVRRAAVGSTPGEEEDEDDGGGGSSCNGGCIAGAVIGSLAGVGLIGGGGYYAYTRKEELTDWMSRRKEEGEGGDEPPIVRQDARRGDTRDDGGEGGDDDPNEREEV